MTTPRSHTRAEMEEAAKLADRFGYVYFFSDDAEIDVKIGFCTNYEERERQLNTALIEPKRMQYVFRTTQKSEKLLHKHFTKNRIRLEWFKMDDPEFISDFGFIIRDIQEEVWDSHLNENVLEYEWPTDIFILVEIVEYVLNHMGKESWEDENLEKLYSLIPPLDAVHNPVD